MLALLRRRLGLTPGEKDALLEDLLRESEQFILGYTGRRTLPAALEGAVIETAAARFNLLGLEGASSHAEGGVSATVDQLPKQMKAQLDMYRIAKVG